MRLGVIDVGSNAAQLLVVDAHPGSPPLPSYAFKRPTLLGEEIDREGALTDTGIERVVSAMASTVARAHKLDVAELFVFATSAVRDAKNRDDVVSAIEERVGLRPQFLTGEDEARLTYHAAHRWYGWSAGRLLLLDIGGGSMEIVLGRDAEPELAISLPLGAGRMTRRFLRENDPPTARQVERVRQSVRKTLRKASARLRWEGDFDRAVATSKTFKQLARLAGAPAKHEGLFARRTLTRAALDEWIPKLAAMPARDRARLRGVSASRARPILAGAIVARETMGVLGIERVDICPWALREGIMLHHLQTAVTLSVPAPLRTVHAPGEAQAWRTVHPG